MNYFPCQWDLAGRRPISWIWPVTLIPDLPDIFLQHRLRLLPHEKSAEGTLSSSAELIEGGLIHGGANAKFSSVFQKIFQTCNVLLAVAGVRELCEQ